MFDKKIIREAAKSLGNPPTMETDKATPPQENPDFISGKSLQAKDPFRPMNRAAAPLAVLHSGTDYVPKTGDYTLEKGEAVVPKEKNMDAMALVPGRSEDKPKKEIHEIRSRKAKSGGIIHEHHHTHPAHHKMEEHTSPDAAAAGAHVASMLGDGSVTPPAEGAPAMGAPAEGAAV